MMKMEGFQNLNIDAGPVEGTKRREEQERGKKKKRDRQGEDIQEEREE